MNKSKGIGCLSIFIILLLILVTANACDHDNKTDIEDIESSSELSHIVETEPEPEELEIETEAETDFITESETEIVPETEAPAVETAQVIVTENKYIETEAPVTITYILNTSSHKIHYPSCSSVNTMAEHNKATTTDPDAYLADGYTWCGRCH